MGERTASRPWQPHREAGAAILHHSGVRRAGAAAIRDDDAELLAASREVNGHALTLSLLGRFLMRAHGGDIRLRNNVHFEEADRMVQGGTTFKMLAAFESWFAKSGDLGGRQLAVLRMLGLFDRPADADCILALRSVPAIAGLTSALFLPKTRFLGVSISSRPVADEDWNTAVSFLRDFGLLTIEETSGTASLDCHALVREYFATQLNQKNRSAWRSAHARLFEYLKTSTLESSPSPTLGELEPLYQAVRHGAEARQFKEAFEDVFLRRIDRHPLKYSISRFGAFASTVSSLSCFFDCPWEKISPEFDQQWHAWLFHAVAYCLASMGRVSEAIEPTRISMDLDRAATKWKGASMSANNLSEFNLLLGV